MSGSLALGAAYVGGAALADILIQSSRAIGILIPDVVIEENHRDDLVITEHPVEVGAAVSDHAFRRPAEVQMRCGWTNSSLWRISLSETYVQDVYAELLVLQAKRIPFVLMTGKRLYPNMLIASLSVTTDAKREYALDVTAVFRQVILVRATSTKLPPASQQKEPAKTEAKTDEGEKKPVEVPASNTTLMEDVFRPIVKWFKGTPAATPAP